MKCVGVRGTNRGAYCSSPVRRIHPPPRYLWHEESQGKLLSWNGKSLPLALVIWDCERERVRELNKCLCWENNWLTVKEVLPGRTKHSKRSIESQSIGKKETTKIVFEPDGLLLGKKKGHALANLFCWVGGLFNSVCRAHTRSLQVSVNILLFYWESFLL